jgi:hypothetical protein
VTATVQELFELARQLPPESVESLTQQLVAHLEAQADPEVTQAHVRVATRRLDEIRTGKVVPVDGDAVMRQARCRVKP